MVALAAAGLIFASLGGSLGAGGDLTYAQRRADPAAPLFDMPAEQFFAAPQAGRTLDARSVDYDVISAAIFHETNLRRRENGKPPLGHDPRLVAAARTHAASMAQQNYVSHTDPHRSERRTPRDRALLAGFISRYLAENIATHLDIHYEAGRMIYRVPEGSGFSYRPQGPPIPRHTYRSFAASLLAQWMNSPEHRRNILADQPEFFGADCRPRPEMEGMSTFYCVQLFGSPATAD